MGRPSYDQLPAELRSTVDELLGSPVAATGSQTGGWSPRVADRTVALVDWPWAAAGNPVMGLVGLLPSAVLSGARDREQLLLSTGTGRAADPDVVISLLVAFSGFMEEQARRPAPPALPAVRAFQAAQARVARDWLLQRWA
jgi:hypothetical protein